MHKNLRVAVHEQYVEWTLCAGPVRLNSPVGVGGRWEADVDADVDILFAVLYCSIYYLQCGV